jgi:hypothetical protein
MRQTLIFGALMLLPAIALAGTPYRRLRPFQGVCEGVALCQAGDMCAGADLQCVNRGMETPLCFFPDEDLFCCADVTNCPAAPGGGSATECRHVPELMVGVCVYSYFRICWDEPTRDQVDACFTKPGETMASRSFFHGDCDEDGIQNQIDAEPCVANAAPIADAGMNNPIDGGVVTQFDAGPPQVTGFRGGGGASCSIGRSTESSFAILIVAAVSITALRRRRSGTANTGAGTCRDRCIDRTV